MHPITILSESQLRACISLDLEVISAIEAAFTALAGGTVIMPPVMRLDVEEYHGEIDVKTAYIPGLDSFAVKMSPGFFNNPKIGLPSTSGLMVLFNSETGQVRAMLMDNGYLTDIRTAAAGAIASKYLAVADVHTVGVLGTGAQARYQMEALKLVRDFAKVKIWGRDGEKANACANELAGMLGVACEVCVEIEAVVSDSQIVVTATPSSEPLIKAAWLHPGLHITAMGSDAEHKNELDPRIVADCDLYVCDTWDQTSKLGELHHAVSSGTVPADHAVVELGQIVSGEHSGRSRAEDITVCDLTGTGAQDTAVARMAFLAARRSAHGLVFEN